MANNYDRQEIPRVGLKEQGRTIRRKIAAGLLVLAIVVGGAAMVEGSEHIASAAGPVDAPCPGASHTVVSGDNLWRIARAYNVPYLDVLAANSDRFPNPSLIRPGDRVCLSGTDGSEFGIGGPEAAPAKTPTPRATTTGVKPPVQAPSERCADVLRSINVTAQQPREQTCVLGPGEIVGFAVGNVPGQIFSVTTSEKNLPVMTRAFSPKCDGGSKCQAVANEGLKSHPAVNQSMLTGVIRAGDSNTVTRPLEDGGPQWWLRVENQAPGPNRITVAVAGTPKDCLSPKIAHGNYVICDQEHGIYGPDSW